MTTQRAVLIDERDRQLGTCTVGSACQLIGHDDAVFVRTAQTIRINGRANAPATVFQEFEVWQRRTLDPIR